MTRKGIILAGGSGSRLQPLTRAVSKQLLPVYDKPMVYYPLSVLMLSGIRDILLISSPEQLPLFRCLLGDGSGWGISLAYAEQARPEGLAQAMIIAETFLDGGPSCLILGDNIFFGHYLRPMLEEEARANTAATVFANRVGEASAYGVVKLDEGGRPLELVEKPALHGPGLAVPGLYFYDGSAPRRARALKPSARGELEITDLNRSYLEEGGLNVRLLGRGQAWLDTGTPEGLLEAAQFVRTIQNRQGMLVGSPEEVALRKDWINPAQFRALVSAMGDNEYARLLGRVVREDV